MRETKELMKNLNPVIYEISIYTDKKHVDKIKSIFSRINSLERTLLFTDLIKKVLLGKINIDNNKNLEELIKNFESGSYRYKLKIKTVEDFKKLYQFLKNKYHITFTKLLEYAKENKTIDNSRLNFETKKEILERISNIENVIKLLLTNENTKEKRKSFVVVLGSTDKSNGKNKKTKETSTIRKIQQTKTTEKEYLELKDRNYLKLLSIKQQEELKYYINLFEDMFEDLCSESSSSLNPNKNSINESKTKKINRLLEDIVKEIGIKTKDEFQLHFITTISIFETIMKYIISKKKNEWKKFIKKWYNYYVVSGYIELYKTEIIKRTQLEKKLVERETFFKYVLWNFLIQ